MFGTDVAPTNPVDWSNPEMIRHPPSWPIDPAYARVYDQWVEWRIAHNLPWR